MQVFHGVATVRSVSEYSSKHILFKGPQHELLISSSPPKLQVQLSACVSSQCREILLGVILTFLCGLRVFACSSPMATPSHSMILSIRSTFFAAAM